MYPALIKKMKNGDENAFKQLYDVSKPTVLGLCNALLCNTKATGEAGYQVFKQLFTDVISKEQNELESPLALSIRQCANKITNKNSHAFRASGNRNFAVVECSAETVVTDGSLCEQILASLPALHRFVSVLSARLSMADVEIAKHLRIGVDQVHAILSAEEDNLQRILTCIASKTGNAQSMTVEEFHKAIKEIGMPEKAIELDPLVSILINTLCDPIKKTKKQKTKKLATIITAATLAVLLAVGGILAIIGLSSRTYYADIVIKDYGTVTLELDKKAAPKTVRNFVRLAKSGFYDGLTFHRIIEGFMMQGGDPKGNGTGGSDREIKGEFANNGVANPISHTRGVVSMARSDDMNSASSQFFIVHEDSTFLDGNYAAFGRVISGMEIVDKICEEAVPTDNNGTIPKAQQPIIQTITIRRK